MDRRTHEQTDDILWHKRVASRGKNWFWRWPSTTGNSNRPMTTPKPQVLNCISESMIDIIESPSGNLGSWSVPRPFHQRPTTENSWQNPKYYRVSLKLWQKIEITTANLELTTTEISTKCWQVLAIETDNRKQQYCSRHRKYFGLYLRFFGKYPASPFTAGVSWLSRPDQRTRLQTTSTWDGFQQAECSNREVCVERTNIL